MTRKAVAYKNGMADSPIAEGVFWPKPEHPPAGK
jgi:hypothetical protein